MSPDDGRVHWGRPEVNGDPFTAGASWAIQTAYDQLFGSLLGELFLEVEEVQRWRSDLSAWEDVV